MFFEKENLCNIWQFYMNPSVYIKTKGASCFIKGNREVPKTCISFGQQGLLKLVAKRLDMTDCH